MLERLFLSADEVIPQVGLELGALLPQLREVDEESRAHIPLERLDFVRPGRPVALGQQGAVLQQATAADLLRLPRRDQLL